MNGEKMEFQLPTYDVYARINHKNKVIKIFSSCFEQPRKEDILIKSGSGDEFVHVGYYQIYNPDGSYHYKIENGKIMECSGGERQEEQYYNSLSEKIEALKKKLMDTDYQTIKEVEKLILNEDYAAAIQQRQSWRDEINRLQEEQRQWEASYARN